MKWSYCERENGRCAENVSRAEIAFPESFVNIEKLSKERNILRRREENAISSGRNYYISLEFLTETEC